MKTGAPLWPTMLSSTGTAQLLKVISGNSATLDVGKLIQTSVERAGNNSFRIMLNGEPFIVRGLPASMLGRKINILPQSSGSRLELTWFATTAATNDINSSASNKGKESRTREAVQAGASEKMSKPLLKAGAGETIIALVQKRLSNGNIRFNIGGKSFESPAPPSVKHGDALILRATKSGEIEVLRVQSNIGRKALALLRNNLPPASGIASIHGLLASIPANQWPDIKGLPQLQAWLNAAESSSEKPINGQQLASLIRDSGQNLESKLMAVLEQRIPELSLQRDLKAILLQISSLKPDQLQAGNLQLAAMVRILAESAGQSASRIEAGQAFNILANIHNEPSRFEFPMLVNQQVINVQMAIEQNDRDGVESSDKNRTGKQNYNVLFTLELSLLGRLQVEANVSDSAVYARIYHDNAESQQFIQQHIQRLDSRLHELGYKEVYLLTSDARPDAEKQDRFDKLTGMRPATFGLLDIHV